MAATDTAVVPPPVIDADSAFHWEALAEHRLLLQRCTSCGRPRFPAMASCPYCGLGGHERFEASGRGTIYAWVVVNRAFHPAFADAVPYTIATVDLEEGPRIVGRLEGVAEPAVDQAVQATYVDHDGWSELRFVAASA